MKKKTGILALSSIVAFSLAGVVFSTLSWFVASNTTPQYNLNGSSAGAYFAYGDGSYDHPYGISIPRHLNNLAWLQYNGMFDDDHYYFQLANDINVDGSTYTIPPIGTEDHPFIGVFDGRGYSINNIKVTNNSDGFSSKPRNIDYDSSEAEIVGLFGVVGNLSGESYTSQVNSIHNFTLNNIQVESQTTNTLIGIVAGYVNGDIADINVGTSTITTNGNKAKTYTEKLSDYGLVGYSTKLGSGGDYAQAISKYYDSTLDDTGTGDDWGGSIDMVSLFERIQHFRPNSTNRQDLDITYRYLDDEPDGQSVTTTQNLYSYTGNTGSDYSGNVFMNTQSTSSGGGTRYYLVGGHFARNAFYETYDITSGWYITDGSGNYLNRNNTSLTNGTTRNSATIWEFEDSEDGGEGYIRTLNEDVYYYLRNNAGTLQLTTTAAQATDWKITYDDTELDIENTTGGVTYRLMYYNNAWVLHDADDYIHTDGYTRISRTTGGNTYYINANSSGTTINTTTNESDEMHWFVDSNGYYYCLKNNVPNYLCVNVRYVSRNENYRRIALTTDYTQDYYYPLIKDGNYLRAENRINYNGTNYYYYLRLNNNQFTYYQNRNTTTNTNYQVTVTTFEETDTYFSDIHLNNELASAAIDSSKERQTGEEDLGIIFDADDTTYLPLNVYQSGDDQYQPTLKNTGYITAGMTQRGNSTSYRSMVVADYDIKMIQNSYSNKKFDDSKVLTIDGSGIRAITPSTLLKYADSKTALEGKLEGRTRVGGLHFVSQNNSDYGYISNDYKVNATNISVQGVNYPEYELPVYSIDFNLKRQGYINFFAGAYNGGYSYGTSGSTSTNCNCFFTLHKVDRSADKTEITRIREIKAIYKASATATNYTYTYKSGNSIVDENGSTNFNYSSYELLFDTDWIGINSSINNRGGSVFYFEIPVDSGEYCLGNVGSRSTAGEGCYLMYLDIGASGTEVMDVVNAYNITTSSNAIYYPAGVDFNVVDIDGNGGGSICIFIDEDANGSVVFTVASNGSDIAITDASGIATYSYKSETWMESYTVSGNSPGDIVVSPVTATRVSYIRIWQSNAVNYDVVITDNLDSEGAIVSSTYTLDGESITLDNLIGTVDSMNSTRIETIRELEDVITLHRETGTAVFEATLPEMEWEDQDLYDVSIVMPADVTIKATISDAEYTLKINGTTVANNAIYPAS